MRRLNLVRPRAIALALPLVIALVGCDLYYWSDRDIAETKARGEQIVRAVEAYHSKYGKYPGYLSELRPEFLQEIPEPTTQPYQWAYSVLNGKWMLAVGNAEVGPYLMRLPGENWEYWENSTAE